MFESITDPFGTGWINPDGNEAADPCEGNIGTPKVLPDGAVYDLKLGDRLYLTSAIWVNARGGYCALSWGS